MHSSPLTPVFTTLRLGLHGLMTGLAAVVAVRALLPGAPHPAAVVALTAAFAATYFAGAVSAFAGEVPDSAGPAARLARAVSSGRPRAISLWLATLTALWLGLVVLAPDAGYLAFGLFFLYLHLLPRPWSLLAVTMATAVAVLGFGAHRGWSVAGAVGPVIGAAVAVGIGLGYQALFREAAERQRLIDELLSTRATLAERERTAGKLAERERLANEIHDTVAQGLSSIQLLLHAAERDAPNHPAVQQLRLAREAAAESLADTRRLIAELSPAALEGQSVAQALERICLRAESPGLRTEFVVEGTPERLPMSIEAALVRIAQGAVANVVRHAAASRMRVTLTYADDAVHLDVVDDGVGIPPTLLERAPSGSFGLAAMRSRVHEQGGAMTVESEPGHTAVTVSFPLAPGSSEDPGDDAERGESRARGSVPDPGATPAAAPTLPVAAADRSGGGEPVVRPGGLEPGDVRSPGVEPGELVSGDVRPGDPAKERDQ